MSPDFVDGWRAQLVIEAVLRSEAAGWVRVGEPSPAPSLAPASGRT
jgi:hypothetical protein